MDFKFHKKIKIGATLILLVISVQFFSSCGNDKKKRKVVVTKEMIMDHNRKLLSLETELIQKYLKENNIEMQQSPTGLWYTILSDSIGSNAKKEQLVYLDYTISLLDGTLCYSAEKDGVWTIIVGKGDVESAVQEALLLLSEGDSIQMIAPPHLAFGLAGDGDKVPGQSILLYNLKVLRIKNVE